MSVKALNIDCVFKGCWSLTHYPLKCKIFAAGSMLKLGRAAGFRIPEGETAMLCRNVGNVRSSNEVSHLIGTDNSLLLT